MQLVIHNYNLTNGFFSLSATRVTTLWLKQQIFFCSELRALYNAAYVTLLFNVYTGVLSSQVQDLIANCFCISLCRSAETSFKICLPYIIVPWSIWCLHSITQCCCVLCSHFCTYSRFLIISILLTQCLSGIMQEIIKCTIRPGCDDVIHWFYNCDLHRLAWFNCSWTT